MAHHRRYGRRITPPVQHYVTIDHDQHGGFYHSTAGDRAANMKNFVLQPPPLEQLAFTTSKKFKARAGKLRQLSGTINGYLRKHGGGERV